MTETKSKSRFLIPAVGAILIVVGSIATYMFLKGGPNGDAKGVIATAKVLPSNTLVATYVTTDSQAWAKLQQFGTPQAQSVITKGLENFYPKILTKSNISYEKDLKPWVGGVMIAWLPSNPVKSTQFILPSSSNLSTPIEKQQANLLFVVGIKDKLSALNFEKKLKEEKDSNTKEIEYKGEKIVEIANNGQPLYSTVLNNSYVALAPQQQAVEEVIDTAKGSPSFVSKEEVNNLLQKGTDVQNPLIQVYVPNYRNLLQQEIVTNSQFGQLPPQTLSQLKQLKSLVLGIGTDDLGVRLKATSNSDPTKFHYENSSSNVVAEFPADTIAMVNGQGISHWWSVFTEQSKNDPQINQSLEQIRSQLKNINIDLDKDIFDWMDGEFGSALIRTSQGVSAALGFAQTFIFKTSDPKTAQATLGKLDDLGKAQHFNLTQKNIGGKNITQWEIPQQGTLFAHGMLDENTVFLAVGEPNISTIVQPKNPSLDNSDDFKTITGTLQKPNAGYFYVNMDQATPIINRLAAFSHPLTVDTNAVLDSIRGFGITANSPDNSTSKVEMLLALKKR